METIQQVERATAKAAEALKELATVYQEQGIYHHERMVRGYVQSIQGAAGIYRLARETVNQINAPEEE